MPGQGSSAALTDADRRVAVAAIDALAADLKIPKEKILVDTIRAVDWSNSSIGCPKPGVAYLEVITPGHKVTLRADGQVYVVHEAKNRAFVCKQPKLAGGVAPPNVTKAPCETARILKVRIVERAESGGIRPTPPTAEAESRDVQPIARPLYYISLECNGRAYMARVVGGTPGFNPAELDAASQLQVKVADGRTILKTENGDEFEAILATIPAQSATPPR